MFNLPIYFFLVLCIYKLYRDLHHLQAVYYKAILVHVITVIFLTYSSANCFSWIGKAIINYSDFHARLFTNVGILPPAIHFSIRIANIALNLFIMIQVFGLVNREEKARINLLKLLLFSIPITPFVSYSISIQKKEINLYEDAIHLISYFVFSSLIYGLIYKFYKSKMLMGLFREKQSTKLKTLIAESEGDNSI